MSNLRQAAQQALAALETLTPTKGPSIYNEAADALRAALAEPEQEPVAWMDRDGDVYPMPENKKWAPPHTMLYTASPQRKPLTDEEIWNLLPDDNTPMSLGEAFLKFARLIEAAHGIKGEA